MTNGPPCPRRARGRIRTSPRQSTFNHRESWMDIRVREARPEDLPECVNIFIDSWTDLNRRHNFATRPRPNAAHMLAFYQHALSTGIFRLAEAEGRIRAFACAVVRDRLWFLSGFWKKPSVKQEHVGMPALRAVWNAGKRAGATHF